MSWLTNAVCRSLLRDKRSSIGSGLVILTRVKVTRWPWNFGGDNTISPLRARAGDCDACTTDKAIRSRRWPKPVGQLRPTEERFLLRVDGQTKRSFSTKESAATADGTIEVVKA